MPSVKVTIDPKGGTKVEADGFSGDSCKDVTRPLLEKLGEVVSDQAKDDWTADTSERQVEGA